MGLNKKNEFFVIEVHHLWTFKNGGELDIVAVYY